MLPIHPQIMEAQSTARALSQITPTPQRAIASVPPSLAGTDTADAERLARMITQHRLGVETHQAECVRINAQIAGINQQIAEMERLGDERRATITQAEAAATAAARETLLAGDGAVSADEAAADRDISALQREAARSTAAIVTLQAQRDALIPEQRDANARVLDAGARLREVELELDRLAMLHDYAIAQEYLFAAIARVREHNQKVAQTLHELRGQTISRSAWSHLLVLPGQTYRRLYGERDQVRLLRQVGVVLEFANDITSSE